MRMSKKDFEALEARAEFKELLGELILDTLNTHGVRGTKAMIKEELADAIKTL